jgi:hypothetical protein
VPHCNHFTIVQQLAHDKPETNPTMQLIQEFVTKIADPDEIAPIL